MASDSCFESDRVIRQAYMADRKVLMVGNKAWMLVCKALMVESMALMA
jgi:hypothetical protein